MAYMHQVVILAVRFVDAGLDRYLLFGGIFEKIGPALEFLKELPVLPWRNDFYIRAQCIIAKLEPYLVVPFSCGAMGNRMAPSLIAASICFFAIRGLARAVPRRYLSFIYCICHYCLKYVIINKFPFKVSNYDF